MVPARAASPANQHFATCPLCEAACGIAVTTRDGVITDIRGDTDDPASRGHICPKAVALKDLHEDPDRLRQPVKRVGGEWVQISWREAIDLTVRGIQGVQRRHGSDALAVYLGNPTVHSLGAMLFAPAFSKSLRTKNRYSATSVDQLPHHLAALFSFGHPLLIPVPDLDHTDCWIIFGANPAVSNGSLMTAPDVVKRLKAIRARGGEVIVIDPRRTETAELASAHHFIRPGTDGLALMAMLNVIFTENLVKLGRVADFIDGLDALREACAPFTPARVSAATGLPADTIRALARKLATTERAVAYGRIGVSTQEFGALSCWLINALNIVTGHLDVPGGAMFTLPAVDLLRGGGMYGGSGRFGRWKSRVRGLPEFAGELPVAALAEEMETPGEGQVRGLVTHAGNPVLSAPNGARLEGALSNLEFFVAIDFYINATTRHAHVILPPTAGLERDHYDLVFHTLAIRNTAKWSPAVMAAAPGARHDWQILSELIMRLSRGGPLTRVKAWGVSMLVNLLGVRGMLKRALAGSRYGAQVAFDALQGAPHGVDLGALTSVLPQRLRTANKRIALAPDLMLADVPRLAALLERPAAGADELVLIGRRDLRSNNSWMANSERLVRGKQRCALIIHPDDAASRGLVDGAMARVQSRVGGIEVEVAVSDAVMAGVVCLPHGWGHDREGVRLRIARAHGGASHNDLTDDQRVDALSGNAAFSGTAVRVQLVAE
ncbi:MAG: molybdopterin-dependent oxidoreductase [Gemmatimonadota bacterium]